MNLCLRFEPNGQVDPAHANGDGIVRDYSETCDGQAMEGIIDVRFTCAAGFNSYHGTKYYEQEL